MTLQLGNTAPDFTAESTQGTIHYALGCETVVGKFRCP